MLLLDRGGFVHRRLGTVEFRRVLMCFTIAVTRHHGGLLVDCRGASMRRSGIAVPCGGVSMRTFGSLQRLEGVQPRALGGLDVRRQTGCQLGPALLQFARTFSGCLGARRCGVPARGPRLKDGHEP